MFHRIATIALVSSLTACGPTAEVPIDARLESVLRLDDHLENADLVGVTLDRDTGELVVLDAFQGLFAWRDGQLVPLADATTLARDGFDQRPYTDVVAIGDGAFAVTVRNDGLRVDVDAGVTTQHFCYLPGSMQDQPEIWSQMTHAVAWNPTTDMLFAQPQSFADGELRSAQVGAYDGTEGGQPEMWFDLRDRSFAAHGMLYTEDGELLLGEGHVLYTYDLGETRPTPSIDLSELGVRQIQGLTLDLDGSLIVADGNDVVRVHDWRP